MITVHLFLGFGRLHLAPCRCAFRAGQCCPSGSARSEKNASPYNSWFLLDVTGHEQLRHTESRKAEPQKSHLQLQPSDAKALMSSAETGTLQPLMMWIEQGNIRNQGRTDFKRALLKYQA